MPKRKLTISPLNVGDIIKAEIAMTQVRGEDGNLFPETMLNRWYRKEAVEYKIAQNLVRDFHTFTFEERIHHVVRELRDTGLDHSDKNASILYDVRRRVALIEEADRAAKGLSYASQRR